MGERRVLRREESEKSSYIRAEEKVTGVYRTGLTFRARSETEKKVSFAENREGSDET